MNSRTEGFDRIIDLGCGTAPYRPHALPRAGQYIGVDIEPACVGSHTRATFRHGDAVEILEALHPKSGDLIISVFSAHHIGNARLLAGLSRAFHAGAEFLLIDPLQLHPRRCLLHWTYSVVSSAVRLVITQLKRSEMTAAAPFLRQQLAFLLSRAGWRHVVEDFEEGRQATYDCLEGLARKTFVGIRPLVLRRVGALIFMAGGSKVVAWTRALEIKPTRVEVSLPIP